MSNEPRDPETGNPLSVRNIEFYGASIQRAANLPPGTPYWKIVDTFHLSGQQNKGNHNVYIDMLKADGNRLNGAKCRIFFAGRSADLTIDKPANEPGTNAPMFRGNFYDVEGLGMPSDKAVGFNSEHRDEEPGNTDGHHSFMVIFQEARFEAGGAPTTGTIRGTVSNGGGRSITLSGGAVSVTGQIGADGSFGFDDVPPGNYTLTVVGTAVSAPVSVQAGQQANVSLALPGDGGGDDQQNLGQQIVLLQAQVASLTQELNEANAARDRLAGVLNQIKQIIQNAGL